MSGIFTQKFTTPQELFKIISRTSVGSDLLESFLPHYHLKKIEILDYPSVLREKLREFIPAGHPIGACLVQDSDRILIYIDFEGEIGVITPYLVHEISSYLSLNRSPKICRESSETLAIKHQLLFTTELRGRDQDFEMYLKQNALKAAELHRLLEFEAA